MRIFPKRDISWGPILVIVWTMMFRRNVLRTDYVALVECLRTFPESCRKSFRFSEGY